jgi:hypothetical protein
VEGASQAKYCGEIKVINISISTLLFWTVNTHVCHHEGQAVLTNIITVREPSQRDRPLVTEEVNTVTCWRSGRSPTELSRDGPSSRDGINKRLSDETHELADMEAKSRMA